eukprot:1874933-Ditylum_brightwellii.AAC.1
MVKANFSVGAAGVVQGCLERWSTVHEKLHQSPGLYVGLCKDFTIGEVGCCYNQGIVLMAVAIMWRPLRAVGWGGGGLRG